MKKLKIVITFLLVINSVHTFSQQTNKSINYICYRYSHSMRIPYSEVTIEIFKKQKYAIVKVRSKAANNDKQWEYSKIKNEFKVDLKTFEKLTKKLVPLQTIELDKGMGFDGTNSEIEFGNGNKNFKYNAWTPELNTDKRGLNYFLDCCKELILLGKLDPKEIFREKGT
ncbi:hypothetical protein [Flavobacterium phycosphaerae]|uniref:hypothetical protein n=1 Tax=Flavobacterium phycosphaerae TaxID=2697515 RepID=UPI0013895771|nr:hypothetical protein [Flavobacterium phycosphaerae]